MDPAIGGYNSGKAEEWVNEFLFHDEDEVDLSISSESIDITELIAEMKQTSIHTLNHPPGPILPQSIPSISEALLHINEVTRYLEALPIAGLPHPYSPNQIIQMSDFQNLRLAPSVPTSK